MKRIKLAVMITIILVIFAMITPKSYAADESFELQLEASSTTLHPGDSFSVNIMIDNMNITSGDQGIGAYQAKIIYDANALELVGVTAATGWEAFENEGNMVVNTSSGEVVTERTHTATINFKVLDNVSLGDTTISLESIQGSSGTTTHQLIIMVVQQIQIKLVHQTVPKVQHLTKYYHMLALEISL